MPSPRITPEIRAAYEAACEAERRLAELMKPLCTQSDFDRQEFQMADCWRDEIHPDNPAIYSYIFDDWDSEEE